MSCGIAKLCKLLCVIKLARNLTILFEYIISLSAPRSVRDHFWCNELAGSTGVYVWAVFASLDNKLGQPALTGHQITLLSLWAALAEGEGRTSSFYVSVSTRTANGSFCLSGPPFQEVFSHLYNVLHVLLMYVTFWSMNKVLYGNGNVPCVNSVTQIVLYCLKIQQFIRQSFSLAIK